ncbi:MAG: hypothetical protein IPK80_17560 [Nannocystis sp.]|nr:hypothetical protein [Nannocystis sp.]
MVGYDGDAAQCWGFKQGISWVSSDQSYTSQIRAADIHSDDGIEIITSTYFGRLKPPNSAIHGSGIYLYRPHPQTKGLCETRGTSPCCAYTEIPIVSPQTLIPCARVFDFQLADLDRDGDLDIVAGLAGIDPKCPDPKTDTTVDPQISGFRILNNRSNRTIEDRPSALPYDTGTVPFDASAPQPATLWSRLQATSTGLAPPEPDPAPSQPEASPDPLEHRRPKVAIFLNGGTPTSPDFDPTPTWFAEPPTYTKLWSVVTRIELFDVDQDGALDIIAGHDYQRTYVFLGGDDGLPKLPTATRLPEACPEGCSEPDGVLTRGAADGLTTTDLAVALLPSDSGSTNTVVLAESRACHDPNVCSQMRPHVLIHADTTNHAIPVTDDAAPLSLAFTVEEDQPLLLIGRGKRGSAGVEGLQTEAVPLRAGAPTRHTLLEGNHFALDLEILPSYGDTTVMTTHAEVRAGAITLPGVGPMKIDEVKIADIEIHPCGPSAPALERCYWMVGGSTLLIRGGARSEIVTVKSRAPKFRDFAIADAQIGKPPQVAWDLRRTVSPKNIP